MLAARSAVRQALAGGRLPAAGLHSSAAAAAADQQHTAAQDAFAPPQPAGSYRPVVSGSMLKRHGRDLTQDASDGRLDPLIGRQDVIERALQVLLRRTKNNPVLIGDPGVGKTALVEGIAQLIVSPAAPPGLRGRALIALDVGSLVAGTQYRGAFEERLTSLLNEVRMAAGRVILFIDELHMLMDAGRVEGGMNAANLLKPALARGDLHCIGATTVEEYRKHIEQDGAFARRFQPVAVEEPSPAEAVTWLHGLRGRYERYHGVRYSDAALGAAVTAAQRYLPERRLPDSAIDVMDEAAARARLRSAAAAAAAADWARPVAAGAGGSAEAAVGRDPPLEAGGQSFEETRRLMEWLNSQRAQQAQQAPQTSGLAAGAAAQVRQQGSGLSGAATHALSCPHCGTPAAPVEGSVTVTCSRCRFTYLSIPQEKLMLGASLFSAQQQQQQLLRMGQAGSSGAAGPAGVGKSTLCTVLAEALFGSERHLLRFNLAEFSDRASVARLVGAPPGYVGYGDGGLLTEAVRRRPHSVVLLERVDRAHPEVASLITQVLETGQLVDSMGKRCSFRNTILVLTTSPTTAPLPSLADGSPSGGNSSSSSGGSSSGSSGDDGGSSSSSSSASTGSRRGTSGDPDVVSVLEGHMHPEVFAGDASRGSTHSGHSAAALCLQPEEASSTASAAAGAQPAAPAQQAQQVQHPLRYVPAELLARLDAALSMQPLSTADMRQVLELQLAGIQADLEQQGVLLQVAAPAQQWLAARGLSPASGAQRLRPLLREQLLLPVADVLLQRRLAQRQQEGNEAAPLVVHVAVAADGSQLEVRVA
ncbi:ATP-dependent chaperone [Chlorella sorokiniana]|uniref:ATP-dependent chaperone n=1 Tax=Chlorella sorokiniana TaxID=3076 RepID=A0A2P6U0K3_CHLSO|nr:ATP-dependent chaperone [Chlorella sorokiniana]|eukprot:PRW59843.1 ATP-dependent chaperone [Chlorella sorokiniana]